MSQLENSLKSEIRITKIKGAILKTVATVGFISASLIAPNALQMMKLFPKTKRILKDKTVYINKSKKKLIDEGLLKYTKDGYIELTDIGEKILSQFEARDYKLPKPTKWDGKWRMLIFDISEKMKGTRDKVRNTLVSIGFAHLQDSVWVYPYDCEDLVNLLKADFMIGKDLLYIIADRIENDKELRKKFDL